MHHTLLAAALLCLPAAALANAFAVRIDASTPREQRVGGSDAIAGYGDWALGNGTLCAAISDVDHQSGMSAGGGALVDLGHCGQDDDQLAVISPMRNLGRASVGVDSIRAEPGDPVASVVVITTEGGVELERRFSVSRATPHALQIVTRVSRVAAGERLWALGEMLLHPSGSMALFTRGLRWPDASRGFAQPGSTGARSAFDTAFLPTDLHVLVSDPAIDPPIAYGWHLREARLERANGSTRALPFMTTTGEDFSLFAVLPRPFWLGSGASIGLLQLAQMRWMELRAGDRLVVERDVIIGARGDVASITDRLHADAPRVRGRVDDPRARLHVDDGRGRAFTQVRPDADGAFAFRAPPGRYLLRLRAPGARRRERELEVGDADLELGTLAVGAPARVRLPRGAAMRLVFRGADGTPDPRLGDDLLGRRFGENEAGSALLGHDVALAGRPGDPHEVVLAPGHYRVYATRGPEFDVRSTRITAVAGETVALEIETPRRALDTPGWIGADLHVHSAISFDSSIPVDTRLRSFAAEAGEVLVASEHNRSFDPAAAIAALGLGDQLHGMAGVEITSTGRSAAAPRSAGHANAFPLAPVPGAFRDGAPRFNGQRLREAIAEVRARGEGTLVQLNHPRSEHGGGGDGSFLEHLSIGASYVPALPLDHEPNAALLERDARSGLRDVDFDAVELLNGPSLPRYLRTRADWLSLWLQGEPRTATANSDSHRLGTVVALPRTWVRVADDRVAALDAGAFVAALREGAAIGSTGPFVDARLEGVGPGGIFRGPRGTLTVEVRAAPWVPVSTLRVWRNAEVLLERPIARDQRVELPLELEADALIWIEVFGAPGETYAAIAPGFTPLAFTNPIRVDADGDGHWTAPGLPEPPPPALSAPLETAPIAN